LKITFRLLKNLVNLGFQGEIYPVNPKTKEILGVKTYARLRDISSRIDLVVTAVPASATMDVVRECHSIGVKRIVIVTGGFSEGGDKGTQLHRDVASFTAEKGIRVLGPNTLSPFNTANNLAISFHPVRRMNSGGLSLALQSGFFEPKTNWLFTGVGVSKLLDMGNKMDINEVDALQYFALDPETEVIAMHLESIRGDGRTFFTLLGKVARRKPTIILKSGRTSAGSRASLSHTGSMARENDVIFDGLLRQAGALRAQNLEEFFDLAKAFGCLGLPKGDRLAIITMSGGEGVMGIDACEALGLKPARLGEKTRDKLAPLQPPWEIPLNPFDKGLSFEFHRSSPLDFYKGLLAIPEDENVDCAIMQMPPMMFSSEPSDPHISHEVAESLHEEFTQGFVNMKKAGKPFALWRSSMDAKEQEWIDEIESRGMPVFQSCERAIRCLAAMHHYRCMNPLGSSSKQ
jgi:acyl-CoA synthetase (NDP forming)